MRLTTLCAWKDPESGSIWLGSDRQLNCGDFIERTDFQKWTELGDRHWVGVSGDPAIQDLAAQLCSEDPGIPDRPVQHFTRRLGDLLRDRGWDLSATENCSAPHLSSGMLCAWRGELYELCPATPWSLPIPPGKFAAIGSGNRFAYGAWGALEHIVSPPVLPKHRMEIALRAAIARDVYSGGEPWVRELKA